MNKLHFDGRPFADGDHGEELVRLEFNITYRCNLSCSYCSRGCFSKLNIPDMTVEEVQNGLEQSKEFPIQTYVIGGGEPVLNKNFKEIANLVIDYAKSLGRHTICLTNGTKNQSFISELNCEIHNSGKSGSVEHMIKDAFLSPVDLGFKVQDECRWLWDCGMGLDSLGYTVCMPGGMICNVLGLNVRTKQLKDLYDKDFRKWQLQELCKHCGVWMGDRFTGDHPPQYVSHCPISKDIENKIYTYNKTKMTETWYQGFKRQESPNL